MFPVSGRSLILSFAILLGLFSCKPNTQPDPVLKGLEERPFTIVNQGFSLDTPNAEETYRILSTIDNQKVIDTIYYELVNRLLDDGDYDLALEHLRKFASSIKPGNYKSSAWFHLEAGESYFYKTVYDSATTELLAAVEDYKKIRDSVGLAATYKVIGSMYAYKGEYAKSAEFRYLALHIYEKIADSLKLNEVKMGLGDNYLEQNDYPKAISLFSSALEYFENKKDSTNLSAAHTSLAAVYQHSNDVPNALEHAKRAVEIQRELNDEFGLPSALNSLAITYMRNKEFNLAYPLLQETYYYIEETNDLRQLPSILHNIGICQMEIGRIDSAEMTLKKAVEIANSSGQRYGLLSTYKTLYGIAERKKDYAAALAYLSNYTSLNDSMYSHEKSQIINELNVRYESELKESKIKELGQLKEIESSRKNWLILAIVLLFMIAAMLLFFTVSRHRKNRQLLKAENQIQEQELNSMKRELEINRIRLQDFTQNLISKSALIEDLEARLRAGASLPSDEQFHSYVEEFSKMKFMTETDWNQFRLYFDSVYPGMIARVTKSFNQITSAELRLFLLIKLAIGNKEVSTMLAISPDSVKKTRYRLKKKLNLPEEASLDDFVLSFH